MSSFSVEQIIQRLMSNANKNNSLEKGSISSNVSNQNCRDDPTSPSPHSNFSLIQPESTINQQEKLIEFSNLGNSPNTFERNINNTPKVSARYTQLRKQLRACHNFKDNYFVFDSSSAPKEEKNSSSSLGKRTKEKQKESKSFTQDKTKKFRKQRKVEKEPSSSSSSSSDNKMFDNSLNHSIQKQPQEQNRSSSNTLGSPPSHQSSSLTSSCSLSTPSSFHSFEVPPSSSFRISSMTSGNEPPSLSDVSSNVPMLSFDRSDMNGDVLMNQNNNNYHDTTNAYQTLMTLFDPSNPDFERQYQQVLKAWQMVKQILALCAANNHSSNL
ncbi:hypothetical protein FDP41_008365 [Naegleria fowleri]|uniref:Uncharacterized protein n=1 Tax=Naegleria fowleri TaxID=5763 RepID=A0A6A5BGN0_NAEFO|nr:uncharacterized protein FDP41_008365 [Naegleria fowleri]KAF0973158.1 hypothetical protein FDP41_008365 [Naegleria fowleri]CAG4719762.1 unnamed protein product [Naegleria fowleri]